MNPPGATGSTIAPAAPTIGGAIAPTAPVVAPTIGGVDACKGVFIILYEFIYHTIFICMQIKFILKSGDWTNGFDSATNEWCWEEFCFPTEAEYK